RDGQVEAVAVLAAGEVGDAECGCVGGGGGGVVDGDVHVPDPGLGMRLVGQAAQLGRGTVDAPRSLLPHVRVHGGEQRGVQVPRGLAEDGGPVGGDRLGADAAQLGEGVLLLV